jgi:subtilase family serine protease
VLGKPVADLDILQAFVDSATSTNKPYKLALVVDNLGDGAAPATSGRLTLTRRASPDIKVATFPVPALGPGHHAKVTVRFAVPAAAAGKGYSLEIDLDAKQHVDEYDESNNSTSITAP